MLTTDQIKAFLATRGATHMPYHVEGGPFLFCDATGAGGWRAMRWDGGGDAVPLMDAPPTGGSQCTPCGVIVDGALAWSVCATYPGAFAVHTSDGKITPTKGAGYELPSLGAFTTKKMVSHVPGDSPPEMRTFANNRGASFGMAGGRQILAATPTPSGGVMLTTYTPAEENRAFHVTDTGVFAITLPDGSHPYKPSFDGTGLWYAAKTGPGWEDRLIEYSPAYVAAPVETGDVWASVPRMPRLRDMTEKGGRRAVMF